MHEIELPAFRGPLDLLLHLIEKDELDITTVSLVQVTDQYLAILRGQEGIDLGAMSEFVAVGSKLVFLKSRALLPVAPGTDETSLDEAEDVGAQLVEMLEQYRLFKQIAGELRTRRELGLRSYPRMAPVRQLPPRPGLSDVSLERLIEAFHAALNRPEQDTPPVAIIERDAVTVQAKVGELLDLLSGSRRLGFSVFVRSCTRVVEIVVSFLAVLELLKAGKIRAVQDSMFGEIALEAVA
jgi:segregation and condensation protein A